MDGVKHCCEPDNCAICHVVMTANNKICCRPLGKTHLMKKSRRVNKNKVWKLLDSKNNLHFGCWNMMNCLLLILIENVNSTQTNNELCHCGIFQPLTYIQMDFRVKC